MLTLPRIAEIVAVGDGRTLITLVDESGSRTEFVLGKLRSPTWSASPLLQPLLELRARAAEEARELGPLPENGRRVELWREERRGAAILLAGLADWNAAHLRRSAIGLVDGVDQVVRSLLMDAAEIADDESAVPAS